MDLVDLCVPNDQHASLAIRALEAGKHVLVEKPIALSVDDADRMLAASKANDRLLMVAHVLLFFPEFAFALDAVRSGRFGRLQAARLTRVISKPDWSSGIADAERSGGPAIDLHIHDTHFLGLLAGSPTAVHTRGVVEQGAVVHLTTQYLFEGDNAPALLAVSGALCQKGRPFAHGFEIYLEQATISLGIADVAGQGPVNPLVVILPDGSVDRPEIGAGDPIDALRGKSARRFRRSPPARNPQHSPDVWRDRHWRPAGRRSRVSRNDAQYPFPGKTLPQEDRTTYQITSIFLQEF